jgi:Protein of unknown function (DUF3592)
MVKRVTVRTVWFFLILGYAFLRWLSASGEAATSLLLREAAKAGRRRLAEWVAVRVAVLLLVLVGGLFLWRLGSGYAAKFRPLSSTASATVAGSRLVTSGFLSGPDTLIVDVVFTPKAGGPRVNAMIEPNGLTGVQNGQHLPIRYDPSHPSVAAYNGSGGDLARNNGVILYGLAILSAVLAVAFAIPSAFRLIRIKAAARTAGTKVKVADGVVGRVRVSRPNGSPDLEWRVLRRQPRVAGPVFVRGGLKNHRWLVVQLPDNRLVWPASRSEPVIGTGMPRIPAADADSGVVGAHHRLLAAYVQVIGQVNGLPLMTHRKPGEDAQRWRIGAPRPVIESLMAAHVRKRLRALAGALSRMAVSHVSDDDTVRRRLNEAGQECGALAATLPRRSWLGLAIPPITIGLAIYPILHQPLNAHFSVRSVLTAAISVLFVTVIFAIIPLMAFFRSVLCEQALFSAAVASREPEPGESAIPEAESDIYRLEQQAFGEAGIKEPREWEGAPSLRWLVAAVYVIALGVPILVSNGPAVSALVFFALLVPGGWTGLCCVADCGLCAPHQKADHRRVGAACRAARRRISPTGHFALYGRADGPEGPAFLANGQNSYSGRFNRRMPSVLSRSERRRGARLSGAPHTVGDPTTAEHAAARPVCLCHSQRSE